ncbi:hypothetical protein [Curtobacterium sp. ZW137]|uniref:hypothetical protein n=1 Tax=Curtobacterium sp. ZW137 TaxID=2485104 RepID=UPI000F4AFDA7|nr:hypothetical protein [Curtobacterium sp. ZW137]ROP60319.1 hypothetical protein EDF55_3327 [Curtobacterium sp. ZW137]
MSTAEPASADYSEITDGVMQLRFADDSNSVHALNAAEVAEVLQGIVEFTSDMAKHGLFGDGMPPEVKVRPVREGSFIIDAILQFASDNPEVATALSGGAGVVITKAAEIAVKVLRGTPMESAQEMSDGGMIITWKGGGVNTVPKDAWRRINAMKRPTRKAVQKLLAPLANEAEVLELRGGDVNTPSEALSSAEPEFVATPSDFRDASFEADDVEEEVETFETEARLQSIDFRPGQKWRVATTDGTRLATIEDEEFLRGLDEGIALHKNDIFQVTIREVRTITNGRVATDWSITNARRTKRGSDDGDALPARSS